MSPKTIPRAARARTGTEWSASEALVLCRDMVKTTYLQRLTQSTRAGMRGQGIVWTMTHRSGGSKGLAESSDWINYERSMVKGGSDMKRGKALKPLAQDKTVRTGDEKYERMPERLPLRQLLDASTKSIEEGRTFSLEEGFQVAREQIQARFEK